MKSLVIEDEISSRMQLKFFLEKYGNCDTAANGEKAIKAFRAADKAAESYDLVCLDIQLPDIDGHTILDNLRSIESLKPASQKVKIFMTTAHANKNNIIRAFQGKCDAFIVKPILEDKLMHFLVKHNMLPK